MEPTRNRSHGGWLLAACLWPATTDAGIDIGPFDLGGAVRVNLLGKSWETRERRFPRADLEFDTLRGRLGFQHGDWSGAAQYRLYHYDETDRTTHFLHHAWLGWDPAPGRQLRVGVHQVPFGNLPFNSHSYFFSLAYYVGLEDDYDLGLKYTHHTGPWRFDVAWYASDEGHGFGDSQDSARYSYDVVSGPGSANDEEHQFNLRIARELVHGEARTSQLGLSLQAGRVPNAITGDNGHQLAAALHWNGDFGPWNIKLQSAFYDYDLANPPGHDDRTVTLGAYDFPYRAAATASLHSVGVSYDWALRLGPLEGITLYENYSVLIKAEDDFDNSHHNVIGASFDLSPFFIYTDLAVGLNNAWIGPDFGSALAEGGPDDDLNYRLNLNIGVYF